MDIRQKKKEIRKQVLQDCANLETEYITSSNNEIINRLQSIPNFNRAKTVFTYVSINREPDTRVLIEHLLQKKQVVCVPYTLQGGKMQARQILGLNELEKKHRGLLEPPCTSKIIMPYEIDFIIVPAVTCGKNKHRLGYGGGYYDRFLQSANCPSVCLCREKLMREDIPLEKHDILMQSVVTESGIYR